MGANDIRIRDSTGRSKPQLTESQAYYTSDPTILLDTEKPDENQPIKTQLQPPTIEIIETPPVEKPVENTQVPQELPNINLIKKQEPGLLNINDISAIDKSIKQDLSDEDSYMDAASQISPENTTTEKFKCIKLLP